MNITFCQKCSKKFHFNVTDMNVPGGKEREYLYCPYCKAVNGSHITSGFVESYIIKDDEKTKI